MCHVTDGGGFMWSGLLLLLVTLAILWVTFTIVNQVKDRSQNSAINAIPLDILKKRFAKGELTKEQFEEMKEKLNAK